MPADSSSAQQVEQRRTRTQRAHLYELMDGCQYVQAELAELFSVSCVTIYREGRRRATTWTPFRVARAWDARDMSEELNHRSDPPRGAEVSASSPLISVMLI
ncbi:MAG: hypothetical protein ACTHON_13390, partial [Humibacter sp.]